MAMTSSPTAGDFEELYDLLYGAGERYHSVRATVVHTVDAVLAKEANRRFVDWRFERGNPGMGVVGKPGPSEREDFYHHYEDCEQRIRIWRERPDRWREEVYSANGRLEEAEAGAATEGPRWTYTRYHPELRGYLAVYAPELPKNHGLETQFSFMLDPTEYVFHETFWDGTEVHKTGREETVAGRRCIEVRADTVSWGYPPDVFSAYHASAEGATDHLLLVDEQIGAILRVAARLDGREFRVAEVTEIAYDEEFPEETFRLELAGVEFERRGR